MFKYPIYFVTRDWAHWGDVLAAEPVPAAPAYGERLRTGNDSWCVQPFLELKRLGLNVQPAMQMVAGALCVAHYDDLYVREFPWRSFIVGCRPDRPPAPMAHLRLVQNRLAVRGPRDFYMPHYAQPGLIPRAAARGTQVARVGYFGLTANLREDFRDERFLSALDAMEITLDMRETGVHDFSEIDVVLAVRPGTRYDIDLKPPSKLINAWLAGCPAILGVESGYEQLRQSELDYICVDSPAGALAALDLLQRSPSLYAAMVENGRRRGLKYTREQTTAQWVAFLEGPATDHYERWLAGRRRVGILAAAPFAVRTLRHRLSREVHFWRI